MTTVELAARRDELGFAPPVDLDRACRRTVEWQRESPPARMPAEVLADDAIDHLLANHRRHSGAAAASA